MCPVWAFLTPKSGQALFSLPSPCFLSQTRAMTSGNDCPLRNALDWGGRQAERIEDQGNAGRGRGRKKETAGSKVPVGKQSWGSLSQEPPSLRGPLPSPSPPPRLLLSGHRGHGVSSFPSKSALLFGLVGGMLLIHNLSLPWPVLSVSMHFGWRLAPTYTSARSSRSCICLQKRLPSLPPW